MKKLFLLRHSKAESVSAAIDDMDRQLNDLGRENTAKLAGYMLNKDYKPALVLCSPAARTKETLENLALNAEVRFVKDLYLATPGEIIKVVNSVEDSYESLMVIGHNPGLHELAMILAREDDRGLYHDMESKFPTSALAVLKTPGSWSDVEPMRATLADFVHPKILSSIS